MRRFVDEDMTVFHGAYGYRLGSRPQLSPRAERTLRVDAGSASSQLDQVWAAYEALRHTPDSRQVVLQIWDATIDLPDPAPRSVDVPCNIAGHLMIRGNRLEWLQVMRSNDFIWGMPYNFVQFTCLQEIMAGWLGVEVGNYVHVSDSLHVYKRHWDVLDALAPEQDNHKPFNSADLRIEGYVEWESLWSLLVDVAVELSEQVEPHTALKIVDQASDLPAAYLEWVALLAAESLRRSGYNAESLDMIDRAGDYWGHSWRRWQAYKR
jgi:thymidylate synthase